MIILDVREKEEFEAEHIPDSISLPLSQFDLMAPGILKNIKESEVLIMCRTGMRAKMVMGELAKLDVDLKRFSPFEGGIQYWKLSGKPVNGKAAALPLMRQVQIVASSMIFVAFLGAHFFHPAFIYLALWVGGGLALSGYTGFCPMVKILQRMPWNSKAQEAYCSVNNNNCCG